MRHTILRIFFLLSTALTSAIALADTRSVQPSASLGQVQGIHFWTGYSFFKAPWVFAPSSTVARDGLGPLFNARACESCHIHGNAGVMALPGHAQTSHSNNVLANDFVVRIGHQTTHKNTHKSSHKNTHKSSHPSHNSHPLKKATLLNNTEAQKQRDTYKNYGEQLQTHSQYALGNQNAPRPEADINIKWINQTITVNQQSFTLSKPTINITHDYYQQLPAALIHSIRLAPALYGLGLIELLTPATLLKNADPQDKNNDGISGRANTVWAIDTQQKTLGKYGHKAEQPTLEQQNATAFIQDIGITSRYYPQQNCTALHTQCQLAATGNSPKYKVELPDSKLKLVTQFTQYLKAPHSQYQPPAIEPLFNTVGCGQCHIPSMPLPAHNIFKQKNIYAYSDFLLHDLGNALGDRRQWANTQPNEWRTTPLWGLGQKIKNTPTSLLHDGRARSIKEAIIWHGGEARASRSAFLALPAHQQIMITDFLKKL